MKVYFLLICVAFLAPHAINAIHRRFERFAADCSQYNDGESLPDRSSCSRYYLCVGGRALRKQCARGLYFDAHAGFCNMAFLVDCEINRHQINGNENSQLVEDDIDDDEQYEAKELPCDDDGPAPLTPTTPAPCSESTPTTPAPCSESTTPAPCTESTPTTPAPCTESATPTTKTTTTKTTTTATTTTKTTTTKTTTTTTKTTTTAKTTTTTCTPTTTTCSTTTSACAPTTSTCTTTAAPCADVTSGSKITTDKDDKGSKTALQYYNSPNDCESLPDETILLNLKHCRRYYVCINKRPKLTRCASIREWFDRETKTCRPRADVTNCIANKS